MSAWQRCYLLALLQCCFLLLAVNGAPGVLLNIVTTMIIVNFACLTYCFLYDNIADSPLDETFLIVKGHDEPAGIMLDEDENLEKVPTYLQQEPTLDNMELATPLGSDEANGPSDDPEEPVVSKATREEELSDEGTQQPSAQGMTYITWRMDKLFMSALFPQHLDMSINVVLYVSAEDEVCYNTVCWQIN